MHPHRSSPRRQSRQVYRLRRALVASAVVLVIFVIVSSLGAVFGGGGETTATTTTIAPSTTTTVPPPPPCAEADVEVSDDPDAAWPTVLVDTARAIPRSYGPGDLNNISAAGFPLVDGLTVREVVVDDLGAMRQAAEENGTPISIVAAYRAYSQQTDLYDRRVDELGASNAGSRVARPGHSEHQLGTTVDLAAEGETDVDQSWGASPAGQWVATNAHKFGFILSYPLDASDRTCYDYEPWHLRYVGREMAAAVIESGLTLREYLWQLDPVDIAAGATTSTTTAAGE